MEIHNGESFRRRVSNRASKFTEVRTGIFEKSVTGSRGCLKKISGYRDLTTFELKTQPKHKQVAGIVNVSPGPNWEQVYPTGVCTTEKGVRN